MFVVFTLAGGKSVHIDTDAILAIEELATGTRIHVSNGKFDVTEAVEAVLAALSGDEDEEDED